MGMVGGYVVATCPHHPELARLVANWEQRGEGEEI